LLGGQYADAYGLRVVRLRPFNHSGPGQSDDYVVGTLTRQVAEAEAAGLAEAVVHTGNPDSTRDFLDVRDVVRAYVAAAGGDATVDLVRGVAPVARVVEQGNEGFAGGAVAGAAAGSAPLLLLLNHDARPASGCVDALRRAAWERPTWGAWQALVTMDGGTRI